MKGMFSKKRLFPLALIVIVLLIWRFYNTKPNFHLFHISGTTMGNIGYNVKYIAEAEEKNLKDDIDVLLVDFNNSLSTYIPDSEISRFNHTDQLTFESEYFYPVLVASKRVNELTEGAFDPTVMPLVNAWGFGPSSTSTPDSVEIASLMGLIGFDKIVFDSLGVRKTVPELSLDFSAIAKGYAVDVIINFMLSKGYEDVFVEIGGEIAAKGKNKTSGNLWTVGIEDPTKMIGERAVLKAVELKDNAVATSGNYRNFRIEQGKKIHHTISPFTGYPVEHNVLSVSVFADNCMEADAFATAFMVLGMEKTKEIVENTSDLDVFLVYIDENDNLASYASRDMD